MSLTQALKDLSQPTLCVIAKAFRDAELPHETVAELYELSRRGVGYKDLCRAMKHETGGAVTMDDGSLAKHLKGTCCCDA
jgi:hypothetical protein